MAMRGYHQFAISRPYRHVAVVFSLLVLPLLGFFTFSLVNHISLVVTFSDLLLSMWRLSVAFIFAVIFAWLLVVVFVRGKTEHLSITFFDVAQSMPTFTILPIGVHYFGQTNFTIILFLIITIIWPIVFTIISALKQANRSWTDAVSMSRISGLDYVRYYLLPITAPGIVTGAIIGLGNGWEALIATEIILNTPHGLGSFFQGFANNTSMTVFGVLAFLLVIFALNKLLWIPLLEKSHQLVEQ